MKKGRISRLPCSDNLDMCFSYLPYKSLMVVRLVSKDFDNLVCCRSSNGLHERHFCCNKENAWLSDCATIIELSEPPKFFPKMKKLIIRGCRNAFLKIPDNIDADSATLLDRGTLFNEVHLHDNIDEGFIQCKKITVYNTLGPCSVKCEECVFVKVDLTELEESKIAAKKWIFKSCRGNLRFFVEDAVFDHCAKMSSPPIGKHVLFRNYQFFPLLDGRGYDTLGFHGCTFSFSKLVYDLPPYNVLDMGYLQEEESFYLRKMLFKQKLISRWPLRIAGRHAASPAPLLAVGN